MSGQVRHPSWCARELCWHGDSEINHASTPTVLRGLDAQITTQLVADDELNVNEPLQAALTFEVESVTEPADPVLVHLSMTDARVLRDQLTAHLAEAEAAEPFTRRTTCG